MLQQETTRGHHFEETEIRRHYEKKISSYENQLHSLACKLSLAEDLERRWVMQELHDGAVQDLAGVQIKLGAIRQMASRNCIARIIDEVRGDVHDTIQNIRSMIFENTPRILDCEGLPKALRSLVARTTEKHGLSIKFTSDRRVNKIDNHYQAFIYRTTKELLKNVVKHARAKHVLIQIKKAPAGLLVQITDDGVGFNTDDIESFAENQHFGVYQIIERTRHYKGRIAIKSANDKGTRTTILLPMG